MFTKTRQRMRAGKRYDGLAAWTDDVTAVPRPGFYALTSDGKHLRPDVPLVCVDDAPDDPDDGSCHLEYRGPKEYPQRSGGLPVESQNTVELEAHAHGRSDVTPHASLLDWLRAIFGGKQ